MPSKLSELPNLTAPQPTDEMYIIRPSEGLAGSKAITNDALFSTITNNIADKALRFDAAGSPSIAPPGTGSLTFLPGGFFAISEAGAAYRRIALEANSQSGLSVGAVSPDPVAPANGDVWYNTATNQLMARINGVNVALTAQPGVARALPPRLDVVESTPPNSTLHEYVIPGGTLKTDGDYFKFQAGGRFQRLGVNQNSMVRFGFAGARVFDNTPLLIQPGFSSGIAGVADGWTICGTVFRTSLFALYLKATFTMTKLIFDANGVLTTAGDVGVGGLVIQRFLQSAIPDGSSWNDSKILSFSALCETAGDLTQCMTLVEVVNF